MISCLVFNQIIGATDDFNECSNYRCCIFMGRGSTQYVTQCSGGSVNMGQYFTCPASGNKCCRDRYLKIPLCSHWRKCQIFRAVIIHQKYWYIVTFFAKWYANTVPLALAWTYLYFRLDNSYRIIPSPLGHLVLIFELFSNHGNVFSENFINL